MSGKDFTETFLSGEEIFAGKMFQVRRDVVRLPDGKTATREYLRHPGAVAVVARLADGQVLLERQYRYALGRDLIELPAGKLEPGEPHLETAKRELLEETGYLAARWTRLGLIHNAIGYSDEGIEIWLAEDLEAGKATPDEGEFLEVLVLPFAEALAMTRDGRITDVKTIVGLMWAEGR